MMTYPLCSNTDYTDPHNLRACGSLLARSTIATLRIGPASALPVALQRRTVGDRGTNDHISGGHRLSAASAC